MKCKIIVMMFLCFFVISSGCSQVDSPITSVTVNQNDTPTTKKNDRTQINPVQGEGTSTTNQSNITKVQDFTADCSKVVIPTNTERDTYLEKEKGLLTVYWYDGTKGKDVGVVYRYTDSNCSESAKQVSSHVLQDTQPKFTLNSIHMIDETNGWAMTNRGVIRTIDGGKTWENVFPLDLGQSGYSNPRFQPYFFLDSMQAWVALDGGPITIFRTSDGGKTWDKSVIKDQVTPKYLTFVDAQKGWMMTFIDAFTGGKEIVEIFRTEDAGNNWVKVATTIPEQKTKDFVTFPLAGNKSGFIFLNPLEGWATGSLSNVEGVNWLYQTKNGGSNWTAIELPPLKHFKDSLITTDSPIFFNQKEGILPVRTNQLNVQTHWLHKIFYMTEDGGNHWMSTTPIEIEGNTAYDFINTKKGWVATTGKLYFTDNGGITWRALEPNKLFMQGLQENKVKQLDFTTDQMGWALLNSSEVFKTVDGGETWTRIDLKIENK